MSALRVDVNGTAVNSRYRVNANVLFLLCSLMPSRIQREVTGRFSLLPIFVLSSVSSKVHLLSSCPCHLHHSHRCLYKAELCFNFFSSSLLHVLRSKHCGRASGAVVLCCLTLSGEGDGQSHDLVLLTAG